MVKIDLNCHQKFEKTFTDQRQKYWHIKLEKREKRHSRLDPTLRIREVVHALNRVPTRAKPPTFYPDVFFHSIVLWVTRKVAKMSWGEFYRLQLN